MISYRWGSLLLATFVSATILSISLLVSGCKDDEKRKSQDPFTHEPIDRALMRFTDSKGMVDYTTLKGDSEDLETYIDLLQSYSPEKDPDAFPTRDDRLAYWINAYNAFVIKGVVDNYPTDSVLSIKMLKGFFWMIKFNAGGNKYSLKHIEDDIVREKFKEPRIHFAISCASLGCPRLETKAFLAHNLEGRLEESARHFINEERNVKIDAENKIVYLSSIFDWYADDFRDWYKENFNVEDAHILDYIKLYIADDKKEKIEFAKDNYKIKYYEYDWGLNDQNRGASSVSSVK